jgi:hypothetical protein
MFSEKQIKVFFEYARKRYQLMLDKESGFPQPWTDDEILQKYRFCNVFREDDRTTKFFAQNIRNELFYDPMVVYATLMFRWFNKIETAQLLLDKGGLQLFTELRTDEIRKILKDVRPIVAAAYIIKTPNGYNKLDGILWCLENCFEKTKAMGEYFLENTGKISLQQAHSLICKIPFQGGFTAYEAVTDLRHTALLQDAPDILTWANPGPGAARGLDRLLEQELGSFNYSSTKQIPVMIELMQELLKLSQKEENWPRRWPKWEMREVEHTLCEVDKYQRALSGEGSPKQLYKEWS